MVLFRFFVFLLFGFAHSVYANDLGVTWGNVYGDAVGVPSRDLGGGENYNKIQEFSESKENKTAYEKINGFNDKTACVKEILYAQERYSIPMNLLLAIGIQESGRKYDGVMTAWPWTVNSSGTGKYFNTKSEALSWLNKRMSEGYRSNDVGCMQINLKWHPHAFENIEDGFIPSKNVEYSAQLLLSLHKEFGSWNKAAGAYHSRTPEKQKTYLQSLQKNVLFANKVREYFNEISNYAFENVKKEELKEEKYELTGGLPIWSAWLDTNFNDGEGINSLYSNTDLEPILPNYK